jgi:hypothetical protein
LKINHLATLDGLAAKKFDEDLPMKEGASVVGQGPAELQILSDQVLRRHMARDGLPLLDQPGLRRALGPMGLPSHARGPVGARGGLLR